MNFKFQISNFLLIFVYVCLFSTAFAQADNVDKFVQNQMAEHHIPGVAIAVVKNGKVFKTKGYGVASVEFNAPVTTETVFEIGSVSKQITAAAIMLLVEDGKINLDGKISKFLPDTPEAWKDVTVRHLLTHTSGVKSYTSLGGFQLSKRYKIKNFINELRPQPLDFEPGSDYKYSNSGYSLLGYIIESASGKNYWEFLRERIFKPLKMDKTADRDPQFVIRNRATGYEWENGRLVGRDYELTDLFSAGAIVSTAEDLAKWNIALQDETILKNSSKNESWKPFTLNSGKENSYGFGWGILDFRGQHLISHGGQTAGFAANNSRYVNADLSVIVLTNLGTQGLGSSIARGIAKIYIPSILLKTLKSKADADAKISEKHKKALEQILRENFNVQNLDENFIKTLSTDRSKTNYRRIANFGRIQKFELIEDEANDSGKIYFYRAETKTKLLLWRFGVNEKGKIFVVSLEEEE
ncbi:MAG: beta-lactamase family protein [Acidobacteriota bacterium]|nr:beta-lactamase family protein [Acidobacteriota bacterium]